MSIVRTTTLVGVLALLLLGAVLWLFVLAPRLAEASEIDAQAQLVASQNTTLQARYNQTLDQARNAPQSAAEAVALFETMPREADLPRILQLIPQAAEDAGIPADSLTSLTTGLPQPANDGAQGGAANVALATISLQISAQGDRESLLAFVDNLRTLDRAVLVKSANYATTADADTVSVGADMFILQSQLPDLVAQVEELLAAAEGPLSDIPAPAPTAPATTAPASTPPPGQ